MQKPRKKVLFLCTGNSCRSQMAEGWARHLHDDRIEAWSAGIEKHGLNPMAVKAMQQANVDITNHFSKLLDELSHIQFDLVITVCGHADEHCPIFPGNTKVIYHGFDDPPQLAEKLTTEDEKRACYQRVCLEIRDFIKTL
ncbi:MAG TPA: arsenate reductase ArsC [Desulfobacterales bacterium]|nr:arsenate reductase ArsC [Desulfobacterales bacterium]